jgi:inner membrane protein
VPTIISHAVVGVTVGAALAPPQAPPRYWLLAAACACLPDADAAMFAVGVPYEHILGHRGIMHSLPFAAALSLVVVAAAFRASRWNGLRARLLLVFFLAAASHGVLDAMTDGGRGIAFFAPFSGARFFLPLRPILTSPISPRQFISWYGVAVLRNEAMWIWLPCAVVAAWVWQSRRRRDAQAMEPDSRPAV